MNEKPINEQSLEELKSTRNAILNDNTALDNEKLRIVDNRISELEFEQGKEEIKAQHEERVQTAQAENAYALDNLQIPGMEGVEMRHLCRDEPSYQALKIAVQQVLNQKSEEHSKELADTKLAHADELHASGEREDQQKRQNKLLQEENMNVNQTCNNLRAELSKLQLEHNDVQTKLTNATQQLDEYKAEIADLKDQLANAPKETPKLEQSEQLKQITEAWKNSRIKVTNLRYDPEDFRHQFMLAERADNGETIRFNYLDKGLYLEVSADDAARFRAENVQADDITDSALESETDVTFPELKDLYPPSLSSPADATGTEMDTESTGEADAGMGQAPQSFDAEAEIAKLKERVSALESQIGKAAA